MIFLDSVAVQKYRATLLAVVVPYSATPRRWTRASFAISEADAPWQYEVLQQSIVLLVDECASVDYEI